MSNPAEQPPARSNAPGAELNETARRALREARSEAVVVLAVDVALLGGLAFIDKVNTRCRSHGGPRASWPSSR